MPLNDTFKKVYGLFVEVEEPVNTPFPTPPDAVPIVPATPPTKVTKSVEQIASEQPGPRLDEIKVTPTPSQPIERPDGSIDYPAIYASAGLPPAPFTAEQVLEILASLPEELPMTAKRATMKVTLNAMGAALGVTPESVVADASRKLAALSSYAESYSAQAATYVQTAEAEILRMESEIARRRHGIEEAKARQVRMVELCEKEADRLDDVLEFFSLDTGASKHAT